MRTQRAGGLTRSRRLARIATRWGWARVRNRPVPLFASLEVTRRCDARCVYCAAADSTDGELTTREWLGILDDLAECGTVRVSLTGGEPTLRRDLPDLLRHGRGRGLEVHLQTNGRSLASLLDSGEAPHSVGLSLDGVARTHDRVRGVGSFDATMDALERARSRGLPVGLTAVLSKAAVGDIDALLRLAGEVGVPVTVQPLYAHVLRSPHEESPEAPDPVGFRVAIERIRAAKRAGAPIANSHAHLAYLERWPSPSTVLCHGGRVFVRITSAGRMEFCGVEGDPSPPGIDARDGIRRGVAALTRQPHRCGGCWPASRAELNLALNLSPSSMRAVLGRL